MRVTATESRRDDDIAVYRYYYAFGNAQFEAVILHNFEMLQNLLAILVRVVSRSQSARVRGADANELSLIHI